MVHDNEKVCRTPDLRAFGIAAATLALSACQTFGSNSEVASPSPATVAPAFTVPLDPVDVPYFPLRDEIVVQRDLLARLRGGFTWSEAVDPAVQRELKWYAAHPQYMDRVFARADLYLFYIVGELERRGMPAELALLPIFESAFDPFAYSHGRAAARSALATIS